MPWSDLHDAPRDRPVWLFLPCAKFTADAQGRPITVQHEALVGQWNAEAACWLAGTRRVYPSMWSDADPAGDAPAQPVLS